VICRHVKYLVLNVLKDLKNKVFVFSKKSVKVCIRITNVPLMIISENDRYYRENVREREREGEIERGK